MVERQEQVAPDAVMTRIGQAVMLHHGGDREEARDRLRQLWAEIGDDGAPLHRCTLAHYLADTQDDPDSELAWDLRALSAADELSGRPCGEPAEDRSGEPADGRMAGRPTRPPATRPTEHEDDLAVRAFYPSLHLNLAVDYAGLGRHEAARSHLRLARGALAALGADAHGDGVRAALARLEARLDEEGPAGGETPGPPRQRP
ncbi:MULTISPECIES: tetratricopeptide repeat protein [Streptomyces]|uniref:Tetratricopeptide repeat protein n=1 Tax=Streptomyces griseiscabiei TaxID=2993540 RepID=A0ABU4LIE2_9ACTN|nr:MULTISPECIES: tetratricopeptide repeat protein [Streptomyces]MBZ3902253.1 tetratricopeptide repeat protein [Streptomyces griseiscabiei]MDX2915592.1 tetratricopeptide repeat protein [Streptomyces griseiscabiei]